VVCDIERIVIHTNFTNTPHVEHKILLEDLDKPECLAKLRAVFYDPVQLRPGVTREGITKLTFRLFGATEDKLRLPRWVLFRLRRKEVTQWILTHYPGFGARLISALRKQPTL
jgi:hypothetical protein